MGAQAIFAQVQVQGPKVFDRKDMARSRTSMLSVLLGAAAAAALFAGVCSFVGPVQQQREVDVSRSFFGAPGPAPAPPPFQSFQSAAPGAAERAEDSTLPQVLTVLFLLSILAFPSIYHL